MANLATKTARSRLKIRREPHWQRLNKGSYLGFRRGSDTWIARYMNRGGKRVFNALPDATNYDEAKRQAEAWCASMGSSAVRSGVRGTVQDALNTYISRLREQGRESTADNAEDRCRLIVWSDPLADMRLEEVTRDDMRKWRERLRDGRLNRSVNRHVRSIVAGLNCAYKEGHVGNPEAWALSALADDIEDDADSRVFLTLEQRNALFAAASPTGAIFLKAIEFTGGRPGELADATVSDFNAKGATLILKHKKGRPAKLRARAVSLTDGALRLFKEEAKGKHPNAPLLTDPNHEKWGRHKWADEVQAAIEKHNKMAKGKKRIPVGVSAYSLRHARISELLQDYGIDPLTIAKQTGTSMRMIEKYYFKFIATTLREKLAAIDDAR